MGRPSSAQGFAWSSVRSSACLGSKRVWGLGFNPVWVISKMRVAVAKRGSYFSEREREVREREREKERSILRAA